MSETCTETPTPNLEADCEGLFGFTPPWPVPAFHGRRTHVPDRDPAFVFEREVTAALLMGFAHDRRVLLHGPHGSGKSSYIEQVAARLNWPCVRVNLDGHITRADLIGRDMVVLRDGVQVTEFVPGLLVWAIERPVALVFDEYDAGRPDVMFVIQRLLESCGRLTLLDQNRVITPHPAFRLFATANTLGQGDGAGLYVGTQVLNQAQLDRWQVVAELTYPDARHEAIILQAHQPALSCRDAQGMVRMASLCRRAFAQDDLSVLMSLRTLITWAENLHLVRDRALALKFAFLNRCDETERVLVEELYQRCFAEEASSNGSWEPHG